MHEPFRHACLAATRIWLHFFGLLFDFFEKLLSYRSTVRRRAAVPSPPRHPFPFTVFSEAIVPVEIWILDTNIVVVTLIMFGISFGGRRRHRDQLPWRGDSLRAVVIVVVTVAPSRLAIERVQARLAAKDTWPRCCFRSGWTFGSIWDHLASQAPRVIIVGLLVIFALSCAARPISFLFIIALVFINRSPSGWIISVGRPLVNDGRGSALSLTGKTVGVPALRGRIAVWEAAFRISGVRTVARHG